MGTSQSEVSHNQANLGEGNPTEDSEGADGVSSEGEKQAVGVEVSSTCIGGKIAVEKSRLVPMRPYLEIRCFECN